MSGLATDGNGDRSAALDKLYQMKASIGYPDSWPADALAGLARLSEDTYMANFLAARKAWTRSEVRRLLFNNTKPRQTFFFVGHTDGHIGRLSFSVRRAAWVSHSPADTNAFYRREAWLLLATLQLRLFDLQLHI